MAQHKPMPTTGTEEEKINNHYQSLLKNYLKASSQGKMHINSSNPHEAPPTAGHQGTGPMKGHLMNWTQMLEAMDAVSDAIQNPPEESDMSNESIEEPTSDDVSVGASGSPDNEQAILDKLNKIFTPILVMQGYEKDISGQIQESFEQANVLTERNIIQFDDATRMSQLIATCAILLQQQKNTENYQAYAKATNIRNQAKINMQKEEYDAAKALAQKYLVMVSTSNNSPVARDAATSLLPETQH